MATVDYLVVHCTASPPMREFGAREIDAEHRKRGYRCIGYHYVIRRDGNIERGRSRREPGAHAEGYDHRSLGIALVGGAAPDGTPEANYTPAQYDSLESLLRNIAEALPEAAVVGPTDLGLKSPPLGFDVRSWWAERNT